MSNPTIEQVDALVERTVRGDRQAREQLFGYIQEFVARLDLRQLGPYRRDPDCVGEVCARVVARFIADDHARLRAFLAREERCFPAFLRVVTNRVAIDLARSMGQNVAARHEPTFRWVREVELDDPDEPTAPTIDARLQLHDVYHYLRTRADPLDVRLLELRCARQESWQEIARTCNLKPNAARQRVTRLRQSLRAWLNRHDS